MSPCPLLYLQRAGEAFFKAEGSFGIEANWYEKARPQIKYSYPKFSNREGKAVDFRDKRNWQKLEVPYVMKPFQN